MRWLVGWSCASSGAGPAAGPRATPVGARLLWGGSAPLWAVGDWRPDDVRVIHSNHDSTTRLAVLGRCGADDDALRAGLTAARGGALRHLTAWPGSYTAVAQAGRRLAVVGDLAGARPVFHTAVPGGTAYATAALPLADLVGAPPDAGHLAALLACPDVPEALGDGTPYAGVRRVPPGHALVLRDGSRDITGYEPTATLAGATASRHDAAHAVDTLREALTEAVRARFAAPHRSAGRLPWPWGSGPRGNGDSAGPGPAGGPVAGTDLSGGSASGTLALLAAGPRTHNATPSGDGPAHQRLLAVTFNDLATAAGSAHDAELARAAALSSHPGVRHVVVAAGHDALPYAALAHGPLTDEPGPALVTAERHRRRLAAGGTDHLVGHGARQALDAHPARLADLLTDRRRRHLLRPVSALARADGTAGNALAVPFTVYRAARTLARTPYRDGLEQAATALFRLAVQQEDGRAHGAGDGGWGPVGASLAALAWCRPGPAARWLTGQALADVGARLRRAAERPPAGLPPRPGERRAAAALHRHAADHRVFEQATEAHGQRLHAPFLDNQVVRACRALPEPLRVQPGARASVLRDVLAGAGVHALPPGWGATSHATHAAAARTGLRTYAQPLQDLFDAPLLADAGLADAAAVRGALRAAAAGEPVALDGLAQLVAMEVWLQRLLARRGTCWSDDTPAAYGYGDGDGSGEAVGPAVPPTGCS
ncbi:asparagine synthase [Streptomyces mashuensis]|uniref:Asparagine synthase n=1 Tax=Streptomyces mashuensis TaxID=33904 RepID=A0A919B3L1_9ACTN|nr:asparagine synthase-related protein [Streptomyces mashuensis]GHF45086.1 asparagine synthase [Streptomyces mashuensis]